MVFFRASSIKVLSLAELPSSSPMILNIEFGMALFPSRLMSISSNWLLQNSICPFFETKATGVGMWLISCRASFLVFEFVTPIMNYSLRTFSFSANMQTYKASTGSAPTTKFHGRKIRFPAPSSLSHRYVWLSNTHWIMEITKYMIQLEHVIRPIQQHKLLRVTTYTSGTREERKVRRELTWGHSDTEFNQLFRS